MQRVLCNCSIRMTVVLGVRQLRILLCKFVTVCCPCQKRAWQTITFMLKTQGRNGCHKATYIIYAAMPTSTIFLLVSCTQSIVSMYLYSSASALNNVVVSRYAAYKKC